MTNKRHTEKYVFLSPIEEKRMCYEHKLFRLGISFLLCMIFLLLLLLWFSNSFSITPMQNEPNEYVIILVSYVAEYSPPVISIAFALIALYATDKYYLRKKFKTE